MSNNFAKARYRVCRAWHVACGVGVPAPGKGEAEGKRKGNCVTARWGGKKAQRESTGRRTGTGYEVWYTLVINGFVYFILKDVLKPAGLLSGVAPFLGPGIFSPLQIKIKYRTIRNRDPAQETILFFLTFEEIYRTKI